MTGRQWFLFADRKGNTSHPALAELCNAAPRMLTENDAAWVRATAAEMRQISLSCMAETRFPSQTLCERGGKSHA